MTRLEVVFETHSLTIDNEQGIATGWNGGTLSERGRLLAAELGDRRRHDGIDLVVASDLERSVETARIAFGGGGPPVMLDWRLREIDYGRLTGTRASTLRRSWFVDTPYPGGESYRGAVTRVATVLDELAGLHPGGRVLVIGHTATRWALDHLVAGQRLELLVDRPFEWREGWEYVLRRPGVREVAV